MSDKVIYMVQLKKNFETQRSKIIANIGRISGYIILTRNEMSFFLTSESMKMSDRLNFYIGSIKKIRTLSKDRNMLKKLLKNYDELIQ